MKILGSTFLILSVTLSTNCAKKEESEASAPAAAATAENASTSSEITVENSIELLDDHIDDIRQLESAADGNGLDEIASFANTLAVIYDFTLKARLNSESYGEAAYEWDRAELDYDRLESSYNGTSDKALISAEWQELSASRARMIQLKAK